MTDQQQMGGTPTQDEPRQQAAEAPRQQPKKRAPEAEPDQTPQMGEVRITDWASI